MQDIVSCLTPLHLQVVFFISQTLNAKPQSRFRHGLEKNRDRIKNEQSHVPLWRENGRFRCKAPPPSVWNQVPFYYCHFLFYFLWTVYNLWLKHFFPLWAFFDNFARGAACVHPGLVAPRRRQSWMQDGGIIGCLRSCFYPCLPPGFYKVKPLRYRYQVGKKKKNQEQLRYKKESYE